MFTFDCLISSLFTIKLSIDQNPKGLVGSSGKDLGLGLGLGLGHAPSRSKVQTLQCKQFLGSRSIGRKPMIYLTCVVGMRFSGPEVYMGQRHIAFTLYLGFLIIKQIVAKFFIVTCSQTFILSFSFSLYRLLIAYQLWFRLILKFSLCLFWQKRKEFFLIAM